MFLARSPTTCSEQHDPSFIDSMEQLVTKGVEEVICVSVNDPIVMKEWRESIGATNAGIMMLADADAEFAKATGLNFTIAAAGFFDR